MPYDSTLDERLFAKSFESTVDFLTVSVYCYNKGAKKMQIVRESKKNEGVRKFSKLGRMTREEVIGIMPVMQEAAELMQ